MNNSTIGLALAPSRATTIGTAFGFIIFSSLGLVSSLLTVIVIAVSRPLHTPCFILISGGGFGSFTLAAHYLLRGVNKFRLLQGTLGYRRSGLECLLLDGVFGLWGNTFHTVISCMIALDRLISIAGPIKYREFGKKHAVCVLIICAIYATCVEVATFLTAPLSTELICTEFNQAMTPVIYRYYSISNICFGTLTVATYAAMVTSFYLRRKFTTADSSYLKDSFTRQQVAVIPTIKMMAILYFITGIMPDVLMTARSALPTGEPAFILIGVGAVLKDASSMVEGVSLLSRNRKFRQCLKKLVGHEGAKVASMAAANNRVSQIRK